MSGWEVSTRLSDGALRGDRRHRRLSLVLIVLLSVAVSACGQQKPVLVAAATPRPTTLRVVFIGDSLTVGLYASTIDHTYASLLAVRWKATLLDRVGIAGVHADGLLDAVKHMEPGATDAVVEVGTNDFVNTVPGDFNEAYRALIAAVHRREPHARIVCLGIWRSAIEHTPWGDPPETYDALIQAACPGPFVSLQSLTNDPTLRGPAEQPTFRGPSDTFHPNDRGHDAIAATIDAAVGP
jgi:lysophospholipase L1-like esterase